MNRLQFLMCRSMERCEFTCLEDNRAPSNTIRRNGQGFAAVYNPAMAAGLFLLAAQEM